MSGRDLEQWPGRVARFDQKWTARPRSVREAILRLAFPDHNPDPDSDTGQDK